MRACRSCYLREQIMCPNCLTRIQKIKTLLSSEYFRDSRSKIHLSGRLIPINKVHPQIPKPSQIRPIVANSCIFKALEHVVSEKLHLIMSTKINYGQIGFRRNFGCQHGIIRVVKRALSGRGFLLFIDFRGAFDRINRRYLMGELRRLGEGDMTEQDFNLVEYLWRYTRVNIGRTSYFTNKGVLQGGVISPMLFAIATQKLQHKINENEELRNNHVFYADDLCFNIKKRENIQVVKEILEEWCEESGMEVNLSKSGIMELMRNRRESSRILNGEEEVGFPIVRSYKYLGVHLDERMNMKKEINYLERKSRAIRGKFFGYLKQDQQRIKRRLF